MQVMESDSSVLPSTGEASPGVLCSVQATTLHRRHGQSGKSPEESNRNNQKFSKREIGGKFGRTGITWSGEEKTGEGFHKSSNTK